MIQSDHETSHVAAKTELASPMFYRMRDVLRMTALSRSSLYRRIAAGTFPAPVSLGGAAKGWRRGDLEQWEQNPGGFKLMESCSTRTTSQGAKVRQVRY
ncbi:helix-turn-helix transcriptional regulator [Castellaniella hirudinis]|uniref:helix-turn-helix transcriptional regulator n=1 Tax=Castellaniella hirudinis TaxID=1144617 RepID=UPI0039C4D686